jgi:signal transduction histidine kinase
MLVERARRAEEGREQEARRRVQQERLRIARELHDAVGHHVALISVQAGAMSYLLDADPAKARVSLAHIQQASEAALEELRLTVGLLRQPGDREPVEPAGGLARLDELIGSFTATGLHVTCQVTGEGRPLPEATDLTAYRVIQESLTNTAKHAPGAPAAIRIAFRPRVLALDVVDDGPRDRCSRGDRHVQRRDRPAPHAQPADRQNPRQPRDDQAGRPRPRPAGGPRLPGRPDAETQPVTPNPMARPRHRPRPMGGEETPRHVQE